VSEQLEIKFDGNSREPLPPILTLREFIAKLGRDGFRVEELRAIHGSLEERRDE
jgi:hypothetical protein